MDGWGEHTVFTKGPVVIFRWRNAVGWPVEAVSANVLEVLGYPAEAFLAQALRRFAPGSPGRSGSGSPRI